MGNVKVQYRDATLSPQKSACPLIRKRGGRRILINYAAGCCQESAALNCKTGLTTGGFDVCISFTNASLDKRFIAKNERIFQRGKDRGAGYFIWKPFVIYQTLMCMGKEDVLFYADAGSKFIRNMDDFFCLQEKEKQDIVVFQLEQFEIEYTKADAFTLMQCEWQKCKETRQIMASFISLKKTFESAEFISEWLTYVQDERIILPQMSIFQVDSKRLKEHRHDQSVLSLLSKKWDIEPWPDISQFGDSGKTLLRKNPKFATIARNFIEHTRSKS